MTTSEPTEASPLPSLTRVYHVRTQLEKVIAETAHEHSWDGRVLLLYRNDVVVAKFTEPLDWYHTERLEMPTEMERGLLTRMLRSGNI